MAQGNQECIISGGFLFCTVVGLGKVFMYASIHKARLKTKSASLAKRPCWEVAEFKPVSWGGGYRYLSQTRLGGD